MLVRTGFSKVTLGPLGPLEERGQPSPQPPAVLSEIGAHFPAESCTAQSQRFHREQKAGECAHHVAPCLLHSGRGPWFQASVSFLPHRIGTQCGAWWAVGFGESVCGEVGGGKIYVFHAPHYRNQCILLGRGAHDVSF